jgi:predicted dehydrogenase
VIRPARVGIVGCGVISRQYAENARAFESFDIVACADLDSLRTEALATEHGLAALTVEELIADPTIDVLLNLTPPVAHVSVIRGALEAGKHVYTEKPLATTDPEAAELVAEAGRLDLRIGCAPDIFLGGAYQAARALIDEGAIGEPLSASAAMLLGGQASWHPDPDIFFADGAGPLLDMGPYYVTAIVALLGSVRSVAGFASLRVVERTIEVGPRAGEVFVASTPTHTTAALELESGATATLVASFEAPSQYVCDLRIYGSDGTIELPDPNFFGGSLRLRRGRGDWEDVHYASRGPQESRGLGLAEMVDAIDTGRPHRASGQLGQHVVGVARAILQAASAGVAVDIGTRVDQPAPLPVAVGEPAAS